MSISRMISYAAAVSLRKQLEHVARRNLERMQYGFNAFDTRRFFTDSLAPGGSILGTPSQPNHLPEAEPILPGHTLIRPSLGMLKSAIKFPHRELENGAGVYGNIDNLGITYDGLNQRLLYTGFRRMPSQYIMIMPQQNKNRKEPLVFLGAPIVVDSEHFTTDPKTFEETMANRVETERAIREFFKNARVQFRYTPDRQENDEDKQLEDKTQAFSVANSPGSDVKALRLGAEEESSSDSSEERPHFEELPGMMENVEDKKTWFANTKYLFNHVNINSQAPEYSEFMPVSPVEVEKLRSWWYYNQDDYKPFQEPIPK